MISLFLFNISKNFCEKRTSHLVENIGPDTNRDEPIRVLSNSALIVENIGVEPMTSCVQSRRSSQLS